VGLRRTRGHFSRSGGRNYRGGGRSVACGSVSDHADSLRPHRDVRKFARKDERQVAQSRGRSSRVPAQGEADPRAASFLAGMKGGVPVSTASRHLRFRSAADRNLPPSSSNGPRAIAGPRWITHKRPLRQSAILSSSSPASRPAILTTGSLIALSHPQAQRPEPLLGQSGTHSGGFDLRQLGSVQLWLMPSAALSYAVVWTVEEMPAASSSAAAGLPNHRR